MSNKKVTRFKKELSEYRDLLHSSTGPLLNVVKNGEELRERKSSLIKQFATLEDIIAQYSKKPYYFDPVWKVSLDAYELALSTDILQRRGPALDGVLDDLDYIEAKLSLKPKKAIKKQQASIDEPLTNKNDRKEYTINEGVSEE